MTPVGKSKRYIAIIKATRSQGLTAHLIDLERFNYMTFGSGSSRERIGSGSGADWERIGSGSILTF